ncbi:MAG: family 10 glycosylhydrolase [Bacteroidales bacterium]|nr:family 10 glycosylhydrolase [Bacteroidales bacterium]
MRKLFSFILLLCTLSGVAQNQTLPKREFRGAWIQIINGQFQGMSRDQMRANLTNQLNVLQSCGVNTIIFQVRGEGDALYASPYEPWTRFLTGQQGKAPHPYWDPLEWMVNECHKRGMELHAWINPFRGKTKGTTELAATHYYVQHPERCFAYDGLIILDPGLQENRAYICHIAADIVRRYDVDGLHIDDYFYPYPVAGLAIPDDDTYARFGNGIADRADWRRHNVNRFISMLHDSIHAAKPWVKFGVSPFGIYHNAKAGSNIPGSDTGGLQNYDDLYADVLYWINKGWVDYTVPQVYWEIGHKVADYDRLVRWWSRYAAGRPLFIGQDVERTVRAADLNNPAVNQMAEKFRLQRSLPGIDGNCLWYSAAVVRNEGNYATALQQTYQSHPALQPLMPFIDDETPRKPRKVKAMWMPDGYYLFWTAPKAKTEMDRARYYAVYRFAPGEKVNIDSPANLVTITPETFIKLPYVNGQTKYTYVVTALDRIQNESKAVKKKVKL